MDIDAAKPPSNPPPAARPSAPVKPVPAKLPPVKPAPSQAVSPQSLVAESPGNPGRPKVKVTVEDPHHHPEPPKNPLLLYLIGISIIAGLLIMGVVGISYYEKGKFNTLQAEHNETLADVENKGLELALLQKEISNNEEELLLYMTGQANLTTALQNSKQETTDKINELTQCKNTLYLAQREIERLNQIETSKCDTLLTEFKSDCNLAIEQLYSNATASCGFAVTNSPDADGQEISEIAATLINVKDYTFPS